MKQWTPLPTIGSAVAEGALPPSVESGLRSLAWEPYDTTPGFLYGDLITWKERSERLQQATWGAISAAKLPAAQKEEELKELEKNGVCWRYRGYGALVYREKPENDNPHQANVLMPYVNKIIGALELGAKTFAATLDTAAKEKCSRLPINKGKGAPFWAASTNTGASIALSTPFSRRMSVEDTIDWCVHVSGRQIGCPITTHSRDQQSRKERSKIEAVGGYLYDSLVAERGPKTRRVEGFPFPLQLGIVRTYGFVREQMNRQMPHTKGDIKTCLALYPNFRFAKSTDASNFDDSVSIQLYEGTTAAMNRLAAAYAREGLLPQWEVGYHAEMEEWVATAKILSPSPSEHDAGRIVKRRGRVPSGVRGTSIIDTVINEARDLAVRDALGLPGQSCVFGDDTLFFCDKEVNWDDFQRWHEDIGFQMTHSDWPVFLQRSIPSGSTNFARMCGAALNREGRNEPDSSMQYALGIRVRRELLGSHPCAQQYYRTVEAMDLGGDVASAALREAVTIARSNLSTNSLMALVSAEAPRSHHPDVLRESIAEWKAQLLGEDRRALTDELPGYASVDWLATEALSLTHQEMMAVLHAYTKRGEFK